MTFQEKLIKLAQQADNPKKSTDTTGLSDREFIAFIASRYRAEEV